jgi:malonyl-ACP decarboxylase
MSNAIAVTGMATLNSVADTVDAYEAALREQRCGIENAGTRLPPEARVCVGAWLPNFSLPTWAQRHLDDPAHPLVRVAARAALPARTAACVAIDAVHSANVDAYSLGSAAMLVAGNNLALAHQAEATLNFAHQPAKLRPSYAASHLDTDVIGVVSQLTGIRGEGATIGAASASSTIAVIHAMRLLHARATDHCLVVSPMCELSPAEFRAFYDSGAMAHRRFLDTPHRVCRPFDLSRQGFVYGQGAAAVMLERLDTARRRDARIFALLVGYGQHLDGRRGTEPDVAGQATAMHNALRMAKADTSEIDYVNAHATASVVGDAVEVDSLCQVFGASRPWVNSTKSLIGHCLGCAGLQELIATIVQMRGGFVHGNHNLDDPIAQNLRLPTRTTPAPIRLAMSNSFAFSGINASLVVRVSPEPTNSG